MTRIVAFNAIGVPQQQGSTRAFVVRGRAVTTSDNKKLKPWRNIVHEAAVGASRGEMFTGPVEVWASFRMPLPASAPKRRIILPDKQPDLDKLVRALFDSMSGVVFDDDKRVVQVTAGKRYTVVGEQPGVEVSVKEVEG